MKYRAEPQIYRMLDVIAKPVGLMGRTQKFTVTGVRVREHDADKNLFWVELSNGSAFAATEVLVKSVAPTTPAAIADEMGDV